MGTTQMENGDLGVPTTLKGVKKHDQIKLERGKSKVKSEAKSRTKKTKQLGMEIKQIKRGRMRQGVG